MEEREGAVTAQTQHSMVCGKVGELSDGLFAERAANETEAGVRLVLVDDDTEMPRKDGHRELS